MRRITNIDQLVNLIDSNPNTSYYVRYSKGPKHDKGNSRNWQTGEELAGLSCNPLTPAEWWNKGTRAWIEMQVRDYSYMLYQGSKGTAAWVLSGTECARGPDNEPLIEDYVFVARINNVVVEQC
jgi:hypothetical protein